MRSVWIGALLIVIVVLLGTCTALPGATNSAPTAAPVATVAPGFDRSRAGARRECFLRAGHAPGARRTAPVDHRRLRRARRHASAGRSAGRDDRP